MRLALSLVLSAVLALVATDAVALLPAIMLAAGAAQSVARLAHASAPDLRPARYALATVMGCLSTTYVVELFEPSQTLLLVRRGIAYVFFGVLWWVAVRVRQHRKCEAEALTTLRKGVAWPQTG